MSIKFLTPLNAHKTLLDDSFLLLLIGGFRVDQWWESQGHQDIKLFQSNCSIISSNLN